MWRASLLVLSVGRIGADGDRWLVVQRVPDLPDVFAQVWHEAGGAYQFEHRRSRADFHGAELPDAGIGWTPVAADLPVPVAPLADGIRVQVEERVRLELRCGYGGRAELAEIAEEWLVDGDERPVSREQARELADRLWVERVVEQEAWEGVTDPERLTSAFGVLAGRGITARENFTCCRGCGSAEIGAEAAEGDWGFVYFHSQCTESAAGGHGLTLLYGAFEGSAEACGAVGREVVAALDGVGLSAVWDGDPGRGIEIRPLNWDKRLVG